MARINFPIYIPTSSPDGMQFPSASYRPSSWHELSILVATLPTNTIIGCIGKAVPIDNSRCRDSVLVLSLPQVFASYRACIRLAGWGIRALR